MSGDIHTYKNYNVGSIPKEVVLYEVLGTKYITPYVDKFLCDFLTKCKAQFESTGTKVRVDLRNCKFNPQCNGRIIKFTDYIDFCDSYNSIIDGMLIHNSNVSASNKLINDGMLEVENIPIEFEANEMLSYIQNLNRSKLYRLKSPNEMNGKTPDIAILISICIACIYPDVSIDITEQCSRYFKMFRRFWGYTGCVHRTAYNLLWNGNILKVNAVETDKDNNYIFYVPGVGKITEEVLTQNYIVMPYEFGTSKNIGSDPELASIFSSAAEELGKLISKRRKQKERKNRDLRSELSIIERR